MNATLSLYAETKFSGLVLEVFLNNLGDNLSNHVTGILMSEERYELHNWAVSYTHLTLPTILLV